MEELGERYFDELVSRSFFQKSSGDFMMHDLMNDLAQYVSGDFSIAFQRSESCKISEKVRHFSMSKKQYGVLNKIKPIVEASNLRTFILVEFRGSYTSYLSSSAKLLSDLLPKLSCVRVLSLFGYDKVFELPDSICSLIHLRYLNLSKTPLKSLPDTICKLYYLQTLLLRACGNLTKLPTNFGELVNLRHLNITGTVLTKMPPRIRNLESLQTLSSFFVGDNNCSGLAELKAFRHLKGSLTIVGLQNVKNVEDVIEANLKAKRGIEQLLFKWGHRTEVSRQQNNILDKLQPSANLNYLTLMNYGGTCLSNWLGDGSLFNLTYLTISDCVHCLSLPSLGQLPSLKELYIHNLRSLRRVNSEFYKNGLSSIKPFKKLVILEFNEMLEWEDWSTSGGDDNDDFPKLEKLSIVYCPKLRGNLPNLLPSLRNLYLSSCSELTAIIPGGGLPASNLKSLDIRNCKNLKSLPEGMKTQLTSLETLSIMHCEQVESLPAGGLPSNLQSLELRNCKKVMAKRSVWDLQNLLFLTSLIIGRCEEIESFPEADCQLPIALTTLILESLPNLERIDASRLLNLSSLTTLQLYICPKVKFDPKPRNTRDLPTSFHNLDIMDCPLLAKQLRTMKRDLIPDLRIDGKRVS